MNKRWRELAKDCYENIDCIYSRGLTDGEILDAEYFIAKAIETAVKEERERMVVEWPDAEWFYNATRGFSDAEYKGALAMLIMLRQHAKVGVGE